MRTVFSIAEFSANTNEMKGAGTGPSNALLTLGRQTPGTLTLDQGCASECPYVNKKPSCR